MKTIIILALGLMASTAKAQPATYNQSCNQVAISSITPNEMTGNLANQRANVWAVKVTNLDAAINICCNQNPAVTCTLGANHGETVAPSATAPYNFLAWIINTIQPWYCKAASGAPNAQVCLTSGIK